MDFSSQKFLFDIKTDEQMILTLKNNNYNKVPYSYLQLLGELVK